MSNANKAPHSSQETPTSHPAEKDRFRWIFQELTAGCCYGELVFEKDPQGTPKDLRFVEANKAFLEIVERSRDEVVGQLLSELFPHTRKELVSSGYIPTLWETGEIRLERQHRHTGRWYSISVRTLGDTGCLAVVDDIHTLKSAEVAHRRAERRYQALFDAAGDALFICDLRGTILDVNEKACQVLGYEKDELVATFLADIENADTGLLKRLASIHAGEPTFYETTHRCKDGKLFPVEVNAKLLEIAGVETMLLIARDVTRHKKLEHHLIQTHKQESLALLAGGIAHDFNNLLASILTGISLAKLEAEGNETVKDVLSDVRSACLRGRALTQQLLTFSRGGAPVTTATGVEEVIRESARFALSGSACVADYRLPDGLWSVEADVGQLSQVIQNLVMNAEQAMPDGGVITLSARNCRVSQDCDLPVEPGRRFVEMVVCDQGVGIPPKYQSQVFDPYFSTKQKGSGLGLATAHSIVRRHKGFITLDSKLGEGTAFHIYLPASEESQKRSSSSADHEALHGHGVRVLIMDDERLIRKQAGLLLRNRGFTVFLAEHGAEALEIHRRERDRGLPLDVMFLDLTVPGGMGGQETVARIRKVDPNVKTVVCSGYSMNPIMSDCKAYGFDEVLQKPFTLDELVKTLQDLLPETFTEP